MTNGPKQFDLSRPIALTCRFILRLEVKRAHLKIEKLRLETNSHLTLWLFAYSNFHTESQTDRIRWEFMGLGNGDHLYSLDSTSAQIGPQVGGSSFYLRDERYRFKHI